MKKNLSKKEAEKKIQEFFEHIIEKTSKEVKKIKRFAMSYNIKLKDKKRTFCKKCLNPYIGPSIHVKDGMIRITCDKCESKSRWKLKD